MLLASEISCSRSNVLVPVSAWSSPAESVSRSRCSSAMSATVWSYSVRSSTCRSWSAPRISSVSAALRVARAFAGADRPVLRSAVLAPAALVPAGLVPAGLDCAVWAIVAPSTAAAAVVESAIGGFSPPTSAGCGPSWSGAVLVVAVRREAPALSGGRVEPAVPADVFVVGSGAVVVFVVVFFAAAGAVVGPAVDFAEVLVVAFAGLAAFAAAPVAPLVLAVLALVAWVALLALAV